MRKPNSNAYHQRLLRAIGRTVKETVVSLSVTCWLMGLSMPSYAAPNAQIDLKVRILNPPNAVTDFDAAPVGSQSGDIQLTWTAPANQNGASLTQYFVRFATYPAANPAQGESWWTQVGASEFIVSPAQAPGVQEFTTVSGLTVNVTYYFGIKSIDVDNQTSLIDTRVGQINQAQSQPLNLGGAPPSAPTGFVGVALSSTTMQWTWNTSGGAGFYTLNEYPSGNLIDQTTGTILVETGHTPNKPLSRTLRAGNLFGLSSPTIVQTVYTQAAVPGAPSFTTVNYSAISIGWTTNGNPAGTQYRLDRSLDGINFLSAGLTSSTNFMDTGLNELTTYYYRVRALNGDGLVTGATVIISTITPQQIDTLAPQAPMGLKGILDPTGTAFTLIWDAVTKNTDSTDLTDLSGYHIYRRAALSGSHTRITPVPISVTAFADQVNGQTFYYTVRAIDTNGNISGDSLFADSSSDANVIYVSTDAISSVVMPQSVNDLLRSSYNKYGVPMTIRLIEEPIPSNNYIIRQIRLQLVRGDNQQVVADLAFGKPQATINIGYNLVNGEVAPGAPTQGSSVSSSAAPATNKLSLYWNNGVTWVKVGGTLNTTAQTMSIKSSYLGAYQLRAAAAASALNLEQANVYPRLFTPNGDGFNDRVYFVLENPNSAEVRGQIFDLMGRHIATLAPPSNTSGIGTTMIWEGKDSKGSVVPSGAYYYKIEGEGKSFTGTVGVAR